MVEILEGVLLLVLSDPNGLTEVTRSLCLLRLRTKRLAMCYFMSMMLDSEGFAVLRE